MASFISAFNKLANAASRTEASAARKELNELGVKGFSSSNAAERMANPNVAAKFQDNSISKSDILGISTGRANEYSLVPRAQDYNDNLHMERGLSSFFDVKGWSPGAVTSGSQIKNITPATGVWNADGSFNVTKRGLVEFGSSNRAAGENIGINFVKPTPEQLASEELANKTQRTMENAGMTPPKTSTEPVTAPTPAQPVPDKSIDVPREPPVEPTRPSEPPVQRETQQPKPDQPVPTKSVNPPEQPPVQPTNPQVSTDQVISARANQADSYLRYRANRNSSATNADQEIANQIGADLSTDKGRQMVENAKQLTAARSAGYQGSALPTGSGQSLQEAAAPRESAVDFNFDAGTVSVNNKLLRARLGAREGQPFWGAEGANRSFAEELERDVNNQFSAIKSNSSFTTNESKAAAMSSYLEKEFAEKYKGGPGLGNWVFGNELHTGAVGAAAIFGTMGVAFGGHKSNADLYSSPF